MHKKIYLPFLLLLFVYAATAQREKSKMTMTPSVISAGVLAPIGEFSNTHLWGVAAEYSSAIKWIRGNKPHNSKTWIAYNGGIAYYFGKEETVSGYKYRYPAFIFIHTHAGLLYAGLHKMQLELTAGPGLGIYDGTTRFNLGAKLEARYAIGTIQLGPSLILMKEKSADPLWSAGLKGYFSL